MNERWYGMKTLYKINKFYILKKFVKMINYDRGVDEMINRIDTIENKVFRHDNISMYDCFAVIGCLILKAYDELRKNNKKFISFNDIIAEINDYWLKDTMNEKILHILPGKWIFIDILIYAMSTLPFAKFKSFDLCSFYSMVYSITDITEETKNNLKMIFNDTFCIKKHM